MSNGYVKEHRIIMSQIFGRKLLPSEIVHHEDGNRANNDPANLEILSRAEHMNLHRRELLLGRRKKVQMRNYDEEEINRNIKGLKNLGFVEGS
ncbi:HNH endonuclease [Candidatus Pacearchaeota archaeon]|nr:HNH endonuclease [Candidatus Pacearchaeota archaeon]